MPPKKRSTTSKEKSAKGNEARGSGSQSRIALDFEKLREAGWTITREERPSSSGVKVYFRYINPAGKTVKSAKEVERQLRDERVLEKFTTMQERENVEGEPQTSKQVTDSFLAEDPDYEPPQKKVVGETKGKRISIAEGLFVATTSSIVNFVSEFNHYFKCPSENGKCKGKLVLAASDKKGLGGAMKFLFRCNGCWIEEISYASSQLALDSRRQMVSLALCLSLFISGHGYAGYRKTLGKGLGIGIVTERPYLEVIDLALPYIKEILDEICEEGKNAMKKLPDGDLGSWSRGVTTCDGCWQIRGHFSQNCTFVIKNYLTGALLYYGHLSMRGADNICNEELWQGTAKAAEGHLSQVLWGKAKEEGLKVEMNWQDADSSSAKGFRYSFPNEQESKIMLCGGHVGRAHGKKLQELQTKSSFTAAFINQHKKDFPGISSDIKCCCLGKHHTFVATRNKPSCGCVGPAFIQGAKRNHYCALVHAGTDPEKYRATMLALGKYHCRDIHQWEGGSCTFHPLVKCSCKECSTDVDGFYQDLKCEGEPYHSANVLKCEFHALTYEIECAARAREAEKVISPGLGKGHSNLPESTFSVLTKFRAKDINLHQKHYQASTNLGLIQASMTWAYKNRGPKYHWIVDLYSRMGLPVLDGIQEMCEADNNDRMKRLERKRSELGKKKRVQSKINRTEEQALRSCTTSHLFEKQYIGLQGTLHEYMQKHKINSTTELRSRSSSVDTWKIDTEITSSRTKLTMAKNKPSLRDLLHDFAEETSAHGAIKISSAKSIFWRLFWVLVSLACLGMVIYQGILLFNTFLDKPTKSDIDVTYIRTVKFPAVTICNLNIIRKSFISRFPEAKAIMSQFDSFIERKDEGPGGGPGGPPPNSSGTNNAPDSFGPPDKRKEAMKKSLKIDSSGAEESGSLNNVTVDEQAYAEDLILGMLAKHNETELERGGHDFHELVFRCNWKDFSCKDGDFMKYWKRTWNWRYGNCYTFNSGATGDGKMIPILTSTKPGPKYGLTLDLFVNQNEYIPSLSQEAGVRVLLTAERSIPFPVDEGFTVSPGFATSIGLRKLKIIRVDPFNNGSCHKDVGLEEFSVYRHFKGSRYSVQGCMYSCLARAQEYECNCTEGKFRTVAGICSETSDVECIQNLQKQYDDDQLGCSAKCPQPCTQISFRTSMSSSAWSLSYEKQLQAMMLRVGDSKFDNMGKDKDSLRRNFLRIKIYFEELNMEKITYSEYYAVENLMSDIGGQLGLWIGVSVITVAEVLKLLLDIFKVLFQKLYFTDVKEIKDINMS